VGKLGQNEPLQEFARFEQRRQLGLCSKRQAIMSLSLHVGMFAQRVWCADADRMAEIARSCTETRP
jgi:hypothetical protein